MVNTFLLLDYDQARYGSYQNYIRCCMTYLDKRRLGKQRVEAQQIYDLLEDYQFLASRFQLPYLVENIYRITEQYKQYQKETGRYFLFDKTTREYIEVEKSIQKNQNQRVVLYRFQVHPALLMWFSCKDALAVYINASIKEWVKRVNKDGSPCKNNMPLHQLKKKIQFPFWMREKSLSSSHRVAMIRKEINRGEKPWYLKFYLEDPLFKVESKFFHQGYYWPLLFSSIKKKGTERILEYNQFYHTFQEDYYQIMDDERKRKLYEKML